MGSRGLARNAPAPPGRASTSHEVDLLVAQFEKECRVSGAQKAWESLSAQHVSNALRLKQVLRVLRSRSSLLRDRGEGKVLEEAVELEGSWMCPECHGLFSEHRRFAHQEHWCRALDHEAKNVGRDFKEGKEQNCFFSSDCDMELDS